MGQVAKAALTANFEPRALNYPTLYPYFQFLWQSLAWWVGHKLGVFVGWRSYWLYYYIDPTIQYLLGRILAAFLGALAAVFLAKGARNVADRDVALMAGLFQAVNFVDVKCSHSITVDPPANFLAILTFWATTKYMLSRKNFWILLAAAFAGAAASTKYNFGLALLMPLAVVASEHWRCPWRERIKNIWRDARLRWAVRIALIVFVLCSPYIVIKPVKFLEGIGYEIYHVRTGHLGFEEAPVAYIYHLRYSFPQALGLPLVLTALVGLCVLIRHKAWFVLPLVIGYYAIIGSWRVMFHRYTIILLPFVCLAAASGIRWLTHSIKRKRFSSALSAGVALLCVVFPLYKSVRFDQFIAREPTYKLLSEFVIEHGYEKSEMLLFAPFGRPKWYDLYTLPSSFLRGFSVDEFVQAASVDGLTAVDFDRCTENFAAFRDTKHKICIESELYSARYLNAAKYHPIKAAFYRKLHTYKPFVVIKGEKILPWEEWSLGNILKSPRPGPTFRIYRLPLE